MNVGFIGAGKVGFSLGKWFAHNGVTVTGYWSRRRESAGEAALFTGTQAFDSTEALVRASDVIFLTVPDGMIPTVFVEDVARAGVPRMRGDDPAVGAAATGNVGCSPHARG